TTIGREDASQDTEPLEVGMNLPKRRPHQRSDKHDVAAPGRTRQSKKLADLTNMDPMVREPLHGSTLRCSSQRTQHNGPSPTPYLVGDCQRQAAAAAQHRERALPRGGRRSAHASSFVSLRLTAMVSGLFPLRMNSMTLPTSGSPPYSAATLSTRA